MSTLCTLYSVYMCFFFFFFARCPWKTCTMVLQDNLLCKKMSSVASVREEEERRCVLLVEIFFENLLFPQYLEVVLQ